jgi:acyl carrier protein
VSTGSIGSTEDELRALLAEAGVAPADASADLPGAGLTSLKTVDLMLAIEDRFGIEFPERLLNRRTFSSLATLAEAVDSLRAA